MTPAKLEERGFRAETCTPRRGAELYSLASCHRIQGRRGQQGTRGLTVEFMEQNK